MSPLACARLLFWETALRVLYWYVRRRLADDCARMRVRGQFTGGPVLCAAIVEDVFAEYERHRARERVN